MPMADGPPSRPSLRAVPGLPDGELITRSVDEPEFFAVLFDRHATAVHRHPGSPPYRTHRPTPS
jgi:hypothetical protein